jgi:hypothetical protein
MAFYYFVVFVYIWEKKKFIDNEQNILDGVESELKEISKSSYWPLTVKIDETKNPIKKFALRFKRKLLLQ